MIEETATVVERSGEFAWVETQRQSTCSACSANKGCGTGVLSRVLGQRTARMKVLNPIGAQVGDSVVVGMHEAALIRGSLAVYLAPLIAMLVCAVVGQNLAGQIGSANPEPLTIAFGIGGLVLGGVWLRRFTRRIRDDQRYQPVILRRDGIPVMTPHWR
ncbi:MAG TPA: SoxR reducing system RseC family protein [Gammaproteobacteria bacterium]|nr:SoxR reducing system RseC family protein [Gammaproteobacteria bacterium]